MRPHRANRFLPGLLLLPVFAVTAFAQEAGPGLTIDRAINLGLQNNREIQLARVPLEEKEGLRYQAISAYAPRLRATGTSLPIFTRIQFDQPILSPQSAPAWRLYDAAGIAAQANLQLAIYEFAVDTQLRFAAALYARNLIAIRESYLQLVKKRAANAPALFEGRRISKSDMEQLQLRVAFAEQAILEANNTFKRRELDLIDLLGISYSEYVRAGRLTGQFSCTVPALDLEALASAALSKRPDLQALRALQTLRHEEWRVTATQAYPTLTGRAYTELQTKDPFGLEDTFKQTDEDNEDIKTSRMGFLAVFTWRVTDGGQIRGQALAREAAYKRIPIQIQELEERIPSDLAKAYTVLQTNAKILGEPEQERLIRDSIEKGDQLFDLGRVKQLDISKAEEELLTHQEKQATARYNMELSKIGLYRASGDLIELVGSVPVAR
jgi:outer membrane protein TolC